jgi:hypothetical protein
VFGRGVWISQGGVTDAVRTASPFTAFRVNAASGPDAESGSLTLAVRIGLGALM